MTKPQFSTEPSMEDILASIRKMISEERLGPRPIPDQIGRSPFGESLAEAPAARSDSLARSDGLPRSDSLETRSEPAPAPAERPAPSFSSLSDALKAATPSPEQRRSLEEKIADMLENGGLPARPASPTDSLAVFAANRPSPVTSPDPGPFGDARRGAGPDRVMPERTSPRQTPISRELPRAARPGSRVPDAPLNGFNGSAHSLDPNRDPKLDSKLDTRPADTATVVPLTPEAPSAPREEASRPGPSLTPTAKPAGVDPVSPASSPKSADTQRIIAMPSRLGAASAPVTPAATTPHAGPGKNGASVSSLGPRPVTGGRQSFRPTTPLRDSDADAGTGLGKSPSPSPGPGPSKAGDTEPDTVLTARSLDAAPKFGDSAFRSKLDEVPAEEETSVVQEPLAPRNEPAKSPFGPVAEMPRLFDTILPAAADATTADAPATSEASPADSIWAKTSSEPPFAKAANTGGSPSDALVDAVVALVHKEPDSLSVFTSGSAFIHGVTAEEAAAPKPGPNMARKLDRSAAELLRPMLRQWLSDNMPRIVEEALRSELMNNQSPAKETDEG
jgi:cell pole-organizing protein PopZ